MQTRRVFAQTVIYDMFIFWSKHNAIILSCCAGCTTNVLGLIVDIVDFHHPLCDCGLILQLYLHNYTSCAQSSGQEL